MKLPLNLIRRRALEHRKAVQVFDFRDRRLVNVPLAVGFAWVISLAYKPAFEAAVIVGYWLTNVTVAELQPEYVTSA